MTIITVKQLNLYLKSLIEGDSKLSYVSIKGELSNFKNHFASGHLYFTLKDDSSSIKCVMFRGSAQKLRFVPKDGMQVICSGRISVYERDGAYQLYAEEMVPDGEGDLMAKFEEIKVKLSKEGLFDQSRKKKLPVFPKKVAVITSETGAAVRDIFNVLGRRYPLCDILLCPATVQGETAPKSLIEALDIISKTDSDLVIIGRGGGSAEDLWCFNDENLARRIATMEIPVISAVGHETDFTICDFVSDLRAPTPSAAAELSVPDREELLSNIKTFKNQIEYNVNEKLALRSNKLKTVLISSVFSRPEENIVAKRSIMVDSVSERMSNNMEKKLMTLEKMFSEIATKIDSLSPIKTMLRGYASAQKQGRMVKSVIDVENGDKITLHFYDGKAECLVENTVKE